MPTLSDFILLIAATAYLTWVVNNTHGPYGLFEKLRSMAALGDAPLPGWQKVLWPLKVTLASAGEMASCMWCLSFWIGLLVMAFFLYIQPLVWVLAVCGFANFGRTLYQHVALPRENKVRIDTATYLDKNYGNGVASKYLELGDVQAAFKAANGEAKLAE